jgi:hypothetical protein
MNLELMYVTGLMTLNHTRQVSIYQSLLPSITPNWLYLSCMNDKNASTLIRVDLQSRVFQELVVQEVFTQAYTPNVPIIDADGTYAYLFNTDSTFSIINICVNTCSCESTTNRPC